MTERTIVQAASINAEACDFCPDVHINLIDREGETFASGSVPLENIELFIAQIREAVAELGKRHSAPVQKQ